jgi:rubrerythrin
MNRLPDAVLEAQIAKEKRRVETYSEQLKVCVDEGQVDTLKSLIRGCQHRSKRAERLLEARTPESQLQAAERLSESV